MKRWVYAAYEAWKTAGGVGEPMLMQRVAQANVEASPDPVLDPFHTITRDLLTCVDDNGPCFAYKRDASSPLKLRVSREFVVTMNFLNEFFRCLILEEGHVLQERCDGTRRRLRPRATCLAVNSPITTRPCANL